MRNMVKFGFIATVFSLLSCSNDFPEAPKFEFCKLPDGQCKSIHVFSAKDCEAVGGEIKYNSNCEDNETETE